MRVRIRLDYYIFKTKMENERYEQLREIIPSLPVEQPIKDFLHDTYVANILDLVKAGFKFSCESDGEIAEETFSSSVLYSLQVIQKKLDSVQAPKANSHLINIEQSQDAFLHRLDKVSVHEEMCTDELQDKLDDDWRIVAVCYQKGSRRPDYVLGKQEKKVDTEETIANERPF